MSGQIIRSSDPVESPREVCERVAFCARCGRRTNADVLEPKLCEGSATRLVGDGVDGGLDLGLADIPVVAIPTPARPSQKISDNFYTTGVLAHLHPIGGVKASPLSKALAGPTRRAARAKEFLMAALGEMGWADTGWTQAARHTQDHAQDATAAGRGQLDSALPEPDSSKNPVGGAFIRILQ